MDFAFTAEAGLAGLFLASFLSATLLPGGSEAVLLAVVLRHPDQVSAALLLATAGNTLGGMTTYGMGRLIPAASGPAEVGDGRAARRTHPAAGLGPLIGDALCAAAGWLRLAWLPCTLWMALGKGARYAVVVAGAGMV
jgi:membrane protein YqaA with SNARE-associated domain